MKLCVVGNGPSAEDHGAEIDACDFVVRIKAWWAHGAKDAGKRCDALAHYGWGKWQERPRPFMGEHWITQPVAQMREHPDGWKRIEFISRIAELRPIRWVTGEMRQAAIKFLKCHPSTGFIAVLMALAARSPDELWLYGFDSTTPQRPFYTDARGTPLSASFLNNPPHDLLAEKRAITQILHGQWLGKPTQTKLIWPDMPELE